MENSYLKLPDFLRNGRTVRIIGILLLVDMFFIVLHVLHKTYLLPNPAFAIDNDSGYAESFQYVKEFSIIILLGYLYYREKEPIYCVWALFFLYLLLDDSLQIHEHAGVEIANLLSLESVFNLRPQDIGEIILLSFIGFTFLLGLGFSFFMYSSISAKNFTCYLLFLFFSLAFCGIVADAAHSMATTLNAARWIKGIFTILEDGGEQIVMSFIIVLIYMKAAQVAFIYQQITPESK